jgi:protein SCO1/2
MPFVAAALTVMALTACAGAPADSSASGSSASGPSVPGPASGTELHRPLSSAVLALKLSDESGRPVTLASLHGRTLVIADFLTACQEVCPMTSVNLRDVAEAVAAAGLTSQVQILEVSVDPDRDTPERLRAYRALFGKARPGWSMLTGTPDSLNTLWTTLGVFYAKAGVDSPAPTDWLTGKALTYDVTHQDLVFIVDGTGTIRWEISGNPKTAGQAPPGRLAGFLNETGRKNLASPPDPSWTARDVIDALTWSTGHQIPAP